MSTEGQELCIGIGMPQHLLLSVWAREVEHCFGELPYHVGSSLYGKKWRDVDVRLILDDDKWEHWFGPLAHTGARQCNPRLSAIEIAFSLWAKQMTGLPVDFQIFARSQVSQKDWDKPRNPLGILVSPESYER